MSINQRRKKVAQLLKRGLSTTVWTDKQVIAAK